MMTFQQAIRTCLVQKYFFRFAGRASRSEFWWFMLFIFLVNLATGIAFSILPATIAASLSLIVSLALLPANLGVSVRRLHDRNMSGWWLLLPIVSLFLGILSGPASQGPVVSMLSLALCLAYLIILCMPGTPGPNRFGDDPSSTQFNIKNRPA